MSYKLPSNMFAVKAWMCMAVSVGSAPGSSTSDRSMAIANVRAKQHISQQGVPKEELSAVKLLGVQHERFLNKGSDAEGSCPSQPDNDSGD